MQQRPKSDGITATTATLSATRGEQWQRTKYLANKSRRQRLGGDEDDGDVDNAAANNEDGNQARGGNDDNNVDDAANGQYGRPCIKDKAVAALPAATTTLALTSATTKLAALAMSGLADYHARLGYDVISLLKGGPAAAQGGLIGAIF